MEAYTQTMLTSSVEKLKSAFVNALGVSPESDFESMCYGQTPGWDSIAHMVLVTEVEVAFEIMLAAISHDMVQARWRPAELRAERDFPARVW
jgi:acyl carrier protein